MDTSILQTFKAAYVEVWNGFVSGDFFKGVGLFLLLALGFYFFIGGSKSRRSLRNAWNYVFPRDLYVHPTARIDRWNFLLNYVLWVPVATVTAAMVGSKCGVSIRDLLITKFGQREALLQSTWAILGVQVGVLFVMTELGTYVSHRLWHQIPLLWSLHRAHHSAEALNFFTGPRQHPVELLYGKIVVVAEIGLYGGVTQYLTGTEMQALTMATFAVVIMILGAGNALAHCHIPLALGRLNYVIGSGVLHQIHHSAEQRHRDMNFGLNLMVFDWMFGTLYVPKKDEVYRWGLNEEELGERNPHNRLKEFYLEPIREFWRQLKRLGRSSSSQGGRETQRAAASSHHALKS